MCTHFIKCVHCARCAKNILAQMTMTYIIIYKLCNAFYRLSEDLLKSETFDSLYNILLCNIRTFIKYQPTVKSQWSF